MIFYPFRENHGMKFADIIYGCVANSITINKSLTHDLFSAPNESRCYRCLAHVIRKSVQVQLRRAKRRNSISSGRKLNYVELKDGIQFRLEEN